MPIDPMPRIPTLDAARAARAARTTAGRDAAFGQVIDLAEVRRRRMTGPGQIPEEVWDAMHRASELADDLAARGERVRFDMHHLTGRVVASLTSADGRLVRRLDLLGLGAAAGPDLDPAA